MKWLKIYIERENYAQEMSVLATLYLWSRLNYFNYRDSEKNYLSPAICLKLYLQRQKLLKQEVYFNVIAYI